MDAEYSPRRFVTMKYGYFDDKAREYVISTPRTPYPWINYLGCEKLFGIISNTALATASTVTRVCAA